MFRIGNCNSKYINEKMFILCNVLIDNIFILNFVFLSRAILTHFSLTETLYSSTWACMFRWWCDQVYNSCCNRRLNTNRYSLFAIRIANSFMWSVHYSNNRKYFNKHELIININLLILWKETMNEYILSHAEISWHISQVWGEWRSTSYTGII